MRNYIQPGDSLTIPAPGAVASGSIVIVGGIIGVAAHFATTGEPISISVRGVFELPKAVGALAVGDPAYWDATPGEITAIETGNTLVGYVTEAATESATKVRVRLKG